MKSSKLEPSSRTLHPGQGRRVRYWLSTRAVSKQFGACFEMAAGATGSAVKISIALPAPWIRPTSLQGGGIGGSATPPLMQPIHTERADQSRHSRQVEARAFVRSFKFKRGQSATQDRRCVASFIADLMKPVNQEIDLRVHAIPRLPGMGIKPILDGLIEPSGTAQIKQGLR